MNLKYKIPNKEEYPEVIDAVYQLFIQGKYHPGYYFEYVLMNY